VADHPINAAIESLIDEWCERRDLRPLATVLPAYTGNNGLTDGWADLMDALRTLSASSYLPPDEQQTVERVLVLVEQAVYRG
jgi:hypothetical protein